MISVLPPKTPMGKPPPITLPKVVKSGLTPKRPWAPESPTLKPVITSSRIRTAPTFSVSSLRDLMKSLSGIMRP